MFDSWRRSGSMAIVIPRFCASGAMRLPKSTSCAKASCLIESVRDAARATAAEHDDRRAEARQTAERLRHVRHLGVAIDHWSGHLQRARKEQIRDGHRQPGRLDLCHRGLECVVREPRNLGRAELDVVETGGLGRDDVLQPAAKPDLHGGSFGIGNGHAQPSQRDRANCHSPANMHADPYYNRAGHPWRSHSRPMTAPPR